MPEGPVCNDIWKMLKKAGCLKTFTAEQDGRHFAEIAYQMHLVERIFYLD